MTPEPAAVVRGNGLDILRFLPRPIRQPRRPAVALGVAWLTTYLPSIALAVLVGLLMPEAPQPKFDVGGPTAIFVLAVVAPAIETLIMGTVLLVLLRLASPSIAVILSALGWGIAHSAVVPIWGLVIWWPFLIFSTLFVVWRSRSLAAAFAMPAVAHGLHNLPSALLLASGINL